MGTRTVTIFDCDRCKKQDLKEHVVLQLEIDRSSDPAGGPAQPDYDRVVLCTKCAGSILITFASEFDHETAKKFLHSIRNSPVSQQTQQPASGAKIVKAQ